ncbi:Josephin domain protein [Nitzschia inconspicua]|uniref:ubiquitinyl hydrolase 1 n=1 Tax=Nitzschia inconspicua TaxID=303405 RepID=A0A9K3L7L5_9STRA|nr:Josephin domain protein [Nitzschia inconspicua]
MDDSEEEYWIYHERQQAMLCGQHSLNNLVQANTFSPDQLAEIAMQLDQMELNVMAQNNEGGVRSKDYLNRLAEGSTNVDGSGNFSIQVLRSALKNTYDLDMINVRDASVLNQFGDITNIEGFIAHKDAHWFAIRNINGRFWNLNSMEERPSTISHFDLATKIAGYQNSGYIVFAVPFLSHQCPPCTSKAQRQRGLPEYWWKEVDLVQGKGNAINGATDPWRSVGSGMRLDGKSTISNSSLIEGLTEEEMLQMALAASMEPTPAAVRVELTAEPPAGSDGAVRIQFRLPDGRRAVRRFLISDPVAMVYAYVESESNGGHGKEVELRAGFPPRDLKSVVEMAIGDASLAEQSVQCRFV